MICASLSSLSIVVFSLLPRIKIAENGRLIYEFVVHPSRGAADQLAWTRPLRRYFTRAPLGTNLCADRDKIVLTDLHTGGGRFSVKKKKKKECPYKSAS